MANRIIVPKNKIETNGEPVIFLAGPVSCAGGWQNDAIRILGSNDYRAYIAVPDYDRILSPVYIDGSEKSSKPFQYQLEWEQHYLEIAENNGAILFWLPQQVIETTVDQKTRFHRTYARDTRPETGGWGWGLLRCRQNAHVAIGGENGFDGIDVIKRNFARYAHHIPFRDKLEDVCADALRFTKASILV